MDHGGKRIGAGRPTTYQKKKEILTVNLRPGLKARLKTKSGKISLSDFVDRILNSFLGGSK